MDFPAEVDLVIYINLDKRTDRRSQIEEEFKRLGIPSEKLLRWPATLIEGKGPRGGTLGCSISHIGALNYVQTLHEDVHNVLILEDDFNFNNNAELVKQSLKQFLTEPPSQTWGMVLLSYHVLRSEPHNELVSRALYSHGTAGYMVNRRCLNTLIPLLEDSRDKQILTGEEQYVLDVYWNHFLAQGTTFYFNQALGYQRESYSDIQQSVMLNLSHVG